MAQTKEILIPTISAEGKFTALALQAALDAASRVVLGRSINVCSPDYGADPTGATDSRAAFQKAADKLAAQGGGTLIVPGGTYRIGYPFIKIGRYTTVRGDGSGATNFVIDQTTIPSDAKEVACFYTGEYGTANVDPSLFRVGFNGFTILSSYRNGSIPRRDPESGYDHIQSTEFPAKVWGIVLNTYLGERPKEPDAVHRIFDIEVWNTAGGIAFLGKDDQGCKVTDIRIRKTLKQGLLVGKPFDHPEAFLASANSGTPSKQAGAADNHFTNVDVSSCNALGGGYAGIEIYTSQCSFVACKSWYVKRYLSGAANLDEALPTGDTENIWNFSATKEELVAGQVNLKADPMRFAKDGAGFFVAGRDNKFVACTSQETGGHGWLVHGSGNDFTTCDGESPSYYDCLQGQARVNEAAGFVFTNWCRGVFASGCKVKNAYEAHMDARCGFYVQPWTKEISLVKCRTENMPFVNGKDDTEGYRDAWVPELKKLGPGVSIEVMSFFRSNLPKDQGGTATSATPAVAVPAAVPLVPAEIGSVIGHWDFSDAGSVTAAGGRVSQVAAQGGGSLVLAQAEGAAQPWVSALAGRPAVKVNGAANKHLAVADIGTHEIGWSLAMVAAVNVAAESKYLYSSFGARSTSPASISVNKKLELRPNSGGGSRGYTAKTAPLALMAPAVIVMVTTNDGVQVWVNGVKSTETPPATGPVAGLAGKAALGAYAGGGSGADATFGELALFSSALTDEQVKGLSAYLASKWKG